jgi:polysaccharide chain length determinant protein (PEP-CTERM system associated)
MREVFDQWLQELRGIWRFRWQGLAIAWAVGLIGWLVVFAIPDQYQSMARVYVDTRTTLRPLLEGLAVEQDTASQLNMVRQALLSRPNLEKVARDASLDQGAATSEERDDIIRQLGMRIEIALEAPLVRDPRLQNTFYRIGYSDHDREKAIQVVDVLLKSFVQGTRGSNQQSSESAQRFLRDQLKEYESRLAAAEAKLADFKKHNLGLVPGDDGGYFERLQTETQELKRLESTLAVATSRRRELGRQRRGEVPYVAGAPTPGARVTGDGEAGGVIDTATRIQQTQARLDELLLRFTPKHPDVIAARETLDELKKRRGEEMAALARGDPSAALASGAAANPLYQSIQLAMNQTDVEIAALQGEAAMRRTNISELRALLNTAPEVEAEYARLNRDYDVTKTQYTQLLQRLEQARISEEADATGIVRFDIIDPPAASLSPSFPPRSLLMLGVLVVACAVGGGVAFLRHRLQPVFSDGRSVARFTGLPVLGVVSMTWLDKRQAMLRGEYMRYAAAFTMLLVVFVVAYAFKRPAARFVQDFLS